MKKIIVILVNLLVFLYVNYQINSFNLNFYHGKDDGVLVRLGIYILFISYAILARTKKMIMFFYGLLIGFGSIFISYLIFFTDRVFQGFFHLFAIFLSFFMYEIISWYREKSSNNQKY